MPKILDIQFDAERNELLAYDNGETLRFNVNQLREARELFHRYDEANFRYDEETELDAFHDFCEEMASVSPEALEVISPYLN